VGASSSSLHTTHRTGTNAILDTKILPWLRAGSASSNDKTSLTSSRGEYVFDQSWRSDFVNGVDQAGEAPTTPCTRRTPHESARARTAQGSISCYLRALHLQLVRSKIAVASKVYFSTRFRSKNYRTGTVRSEYCVRLFFRIVRLLCFLCELLSRSHCCSLQTFARQLANSFIFWVFFIFLKTLFSV